MSVSDKTLRKNAIPFQAKWFSNYVATQTGSQLANGIADGDLTAFANGGDAQIRMSTPAKGDLTEARLTINAVAPDTGVVQFGIYIGEFDTDGVTPKTLTLDEKLRRHKILTGRSDWITYGVQANIYWDGLNLFPFLPKRGDANFNEDGFIIGIVCAIKNPPVFAPFFLYEFKVDCSTQMAEVQK